MVIVQQQGVEIQEHILLHKSKHQYGCSDPQACMQSPFQHHSSRGKSRGKSLILVGSFPTRPSKQRQAVTSPVNSAELHQVYSS